MTVIAGLVLAVLVPSVMSVAVTVWEPSVLSVTLAVRVPADKAPLAGRVALVSLEVMPTVWVLLTRFQFASTDRTVTLKAVPAGWAVGVPVLPVAVPGAAVSPGTNSCNFTNGTGVDRDRRTGVGRLAAVGDVAGRERAACRQSSSVTLKALRAGNQRGVRPAGWRWRRRR